MDPLTRNSTQLTTRGSIQLGSKLTNSATSSPVPSMPGNRKSASVSSSIAIHTTKCFVHGWSATPTLLENRVTSR